MTASSSSDVSLALVTSDAEEAVGEERAGGGGGGVDDMASVIGVVVMSSSSSSSSFLTLGTAGLKNLLLESLCFRISFILVMISVYCGP